MLLRGIRKCGIQTARYPSVRGFASDSSHDDFKPKLKPQPGAPADEADVMAVIKKQVTENPIMLYMKVILQNASFLF